MWRTSNRRKEHDLAHDETQKEHELVQDERRKGHGVQHEETQKRARFGARRNRETSMHDLVHEETTRARFGARRNAETSTIWCTKKRQEHGLAYDETQKIARFGA